MSNVFEKADAICGLLNYVQYSFQQQNKKFIKNWHHEKVCDLLEQVLIGKKQNIIINIPPRHSKTQLVQSFLEWVYGLFPHSNTLYTSYSQTLATTISANVRDTIGQDWYKDLFPNIEIKSDSMAKDNWASFDIASPNNIGKFKAVASGGQITGFGAGTVEQGFGGCVIIDDPLKPLDARSDTARDMVNQWFTNTLYSRLNSPDTPIIIIMQRLHEDDLVGYLTEYASEYDAWHILSIPAINDTDEVLWPHIMPRERLQAMEQMNPIEYRTQYLQQPITLEGTLFKRENLSLHVSLEKAITGEKFTELPCWISTDFAVTEGRGDYTVFSVLVMDKENNVYLIDQYREQTTSDIWCQVLAQMTQQHNPKEIFVEKGGILNSVEPLIKAEMARAGVHATITPIARVRDKVTTAQTFLGEYNLGKFHIIAEQKWTVPFFSELLAFSETAKHDDQVDSVSLFYMDFKRIIDSNFDKNLDVVFPSMIPHNF